jgi:uncharacterized protein YdeI (YjbR/CyaY-like superfamily)
MEIGKKIHATTRGQWRAWLKKNHRAACEIWLVFFKKHTGKPRVSYNDAVEEALCFGWIDGIAKTIDDTRYAQRFTPRRTGSNWSTINRRRYAELVAGGRMTPSGAAVAPTPATSAVKRDDSVPPELKKDRVAWRNFQTLAPSHRRMYSLWINDAKKPETRQRRLAEALSLLRQNKKLPLK